MLVERVPAQLVPHRRPRLRAPRLHKAVEDKPAVAIAHRTVPKVVKLGLAAVHHAAVATTGNRSAQHQAAELTGSAAFHLGNPGGSSSP